MRIWVTLAGPRSGSRGSPGLPGASPQLLRQGAVLLATPEMSSHPFYALVPSWALVPHGPVATMATIIASQAVISGAFSLTQQAIQLGYFPRLRVTHTSAAQIGQIYIAPINWILMVCTIALVIGFQSSSKLAAAYGVAVTATMLITRQSLHDNAEEMGLEPVGGGAAHRNVLRSRRRVLRCQYRKDPARRRGFHWSSVPWFL